MCARVYAGVFESNCSNWCRSWVVSSSRSSAGGVLVRVAALTDSAICATEIASARIALATASEVAIPLTAKALLKGVICALCLQHTYKCGMWLPFQLPDLLADCCCNMQHLSASLVKNTLWHLYKSKKKLYNKKLASKQMATVCCRNGRHEAGI